MLAHSPPAELVPGTWSLGPGASGGLQACCLGSGAWDIRVPASLGSGIWGLERGVEGLGRAWGLGFGARGIRGDHSVPPNQYMYLSPMTVTFEMGFDDFSAILKRF